MDKGSCKNAERDVLHHSYGYNVDEFRDALRASAGQDAEIVLIHKTRNLGILCGFVREFREVRCFVESDSVLEKRILEEERLLDGDMESIRRRVLEIEGREERFETPSRDTFLCIPYYANPSSFDTWMPRFFSIEAVTRWMFTRRMQKIPLREEIDARISVETPCFDSEMRGVSFVWLGHACVLVRLNGMTIITDPIFSERASFLSFAGPKRHVQPPCMPEELPVVDVVLISHDHHDHLNKDAVCRISARSPAARWFVPLGIDALLRRWGVGNARGLTWGEEWKETVSVDGGRRMLSATCVPAQHWSARFGYDLFRRLWAGWVVSVDDRTFYYTGDTGFCRKEFLKIGLRFDVDLAAIPIGCYEPSWFMHPQHISPKEAVAVHRMTGAKQSVAVHWGTYAMGSSEGFFSPKEDLEREAAEKGVGDELVIAVPGRLYRC